MSCMKIVTVAVALVWIAGCSAGRSSGGGRGRDAGPRPDGMVGGCEDSADMDGDGIADSIEGDADIDMDGIPSNRDDDSDGDGYLDSEERGEGGNPCAPRNSDGDPTPDF